MSARRLRILLCVKRDMAGAIVLNHMLENLAENNDIYVLLSDKTRQAEDSIQELKELKMLERSIPDIIFPMLDKLRWQGARYLTFSGLMRKYGVGIETVHSVSTPEVVARITAFAPDLIISTRFSHIFKRNVIDIPRYGIINVHPGALPQYGGLFAPMRAILAGDSEVVVTCHYVDTGIDTGPIIGTASLPFTTAHSLDWYVMNLYPLGVRHAYEAVATIKAGGIPRAVTQTQEGRGYYSMPTANEFTRLAEMGVRLYDPEEYLQFLSGFLPASTNVHELGKTARLQVVPELLVGR